MLACSLGIGVAQTRRSLPVALMARGAADNRTNGECEDCCTRIERVRSVSELL